MGKGSTQAAAGNMTVGARRKSGSYVSQPGVPAAVALALNTVALTPWVIAEPIPFDSLSIYCSTLVAGSAYRVVLYGDDGTGNVGANLYEVTGFATTAVGAVTVAAVGTIPAGMVWVGGGPTTGAPAVVGIFGGMLVSNPAMSFALQYGGQFQTVGAVGAAPDPFVASGNASGVPRVWFQMT